MHRFETNHVAGIQWQRVVLITGANKGIGFEVARQLGRAGFTVLLGARDSSRGEEAASKLRGEGLDVRFVAADLNDASSSASHLAKQIKIEFGHLNVLVNNAGVFERGDGHASDVSIETLRSTFETNFFGTVAFTQPLLPLLRAAENARIVNVSSGLVFDRDQRRPKHSVLRHESARLQRLESSAQHVHCRPGVRPARYQDQGQLCMSGVYRHRSEQPFRTSDPGGGSHRDCSSGPSAWTMDPLARFIHKDGEYPW